MSGQVQAQEAMLESPHPSTGLRFSGDLLVKQQDPVPSQPTTVSQEPYFSRKPFCEGTCLGQNLPTEPAQTASGSGGHTAGDKHRAGS